MRSTIFGVALAVSMNGGGAEAEEIWAWSDREGIAHYTNHLESVPDDYRQSAETVVRWRAPRAMPREEEARPKGPVGRPEGFAADRAPREELREAFDAGYAAASDLRRPPVAASPPVAAVANPFPRVVTSAPVFQSARPGARGPLLRSTRMEFLRGPLPKPLFRPMRDRFIRKGGVVSSWRERTTR